MINNNQTLTEFGDTDYCLHSSADNQRALTHFLLLYLLCRTDYRLQLAMLLPSLCLDKINFKNIGF